MDQFIHLNNRITDESYVLNDEGVIITEKYAMLMDLKVGDQLTITDDKLGNKRVEITKIAENHMHHYIYMSSKLYESLYQKEPEYNQFYVNMIMKGMDIIIFVLIGAAGALAFVVLYNLNNINISERKRELATIKVLGFYDLEVEEYVYRENILLTVIGTIVGIFLGIILHRYVIITAELDLIMFG